MRFRLCRYCGGLHNVAAWPHNCMSPAPARSDHPAPMLIRDNIDLLWHPCDGNYYDSKRKMAAVGKEHGAIEVGNEIQKENIVLDNCSPEDVLQAVAMVEQGYKPQVETVDVQADGNWV